MFDPEELEKFSFCVPAVPFTRGPRYTSGGVFLIISSNDSSLLI